MANARQSRATSPLFFLKSGCRNKVLVVSGNRATANFEHFTQFGDFRSTLDQVVQVQCQTGALCALGRDTSLL